MPSSTGNIDFSFNKKKLINIFTGCLFSFIPFYYILIFISTFYLVSIKYKKYYFADRNVKDRLDVKTFRYIDTITSSSPFNFLSKDISNETTKNGNMRSSDKYIGLSPDSYIKIILAFVFTFTLILDGLIRNLIFSIYVCIIQSNPLNNPYNNPANVTKLKDNIILSIVKNYFGVIAISLIFLLPIFVPYFVRFMKFDNYDLKKNKWFPYIILFLIFSPFIVSILCKASLYKRLRIFPSLNKYLERKEQNFVNSIENNYVVRVTDIMFYIFIILSYCFYYYVYISSKKESNGEKTGIMFYLILFIALIFIPLVIFFFILNLLFVNNHSKVVSNNIVNNINRYGAKSLYELLVKYNYPCFRK
jgi:hypothetical protein